MKFKPEQIKQLRKNFCSIKSWLSIRKKQAEIKCPECKRLYSDIPHDSLAFMIVEGKPNQHLCNDCADKYIEMGVEDLDAKIKTMANVKSEALNEINNLLQQLKITNTYKYSPYHEDKLNKMSLDEMNNVIQELSKKLEYKNFIDSIDTSNWTPLDGYLIKQYNVHVDNMFLKHESQIEKYFKEYTDLFDCGQGFYEDKKVMIATIADKFYEVTMYAEIGSAKQDRGDRLYWVESIEKVEYKEIDKPAEKAILDVVYTLKLTSEQKGKLDKFVEELIK
jgi:hypothetical protein